MMYLVLNEHGWNGYPRLHEIEFSQEQLEAAIENGAQLSPVVQPNPPVLPEDHPKRR